MKKQIPNKIHGLSRATIILILLLLVGCESISISTPDLLKPASMSPTVGVSPNQNYQEVMKFSATASPRMPSSQKSNLVQDQMIEVVKGSKRHAIQGIEINVEGYIVGSFFPIPWGYNETRVSLKGFVVKVN